MTNLFDKLYSQFTADTLKDVQTAEAYVEYCKRAMRGQRLNGLQYNMQGQVCLVMADNSLLTLGEPDTVVDANQTISLPFTAQQRPLDRPRTLEAPAVSFTNGPVK